MDRFDPEQELRLAVVADLLRRQRPAATYDELERVTRRLHTSRAPRRLPRPSSRLVVAICIAFGLLFMTAGSGLAISGFAPPGAADHGLYPDRALGGPPGPATGTDKSRPGRLSPLSGLDQIQPAGRTATVEVFLRQAETRNELPFSGLDAIPILVAGIALIATGAAVNRHTRGARLV